MTRLAQSFVFGTVAGMLVMASAAQANLIVSAGDWTLQPNQPGQVIYVNISGGDAIEGATLNVQVTGNAPRPAFTGGDLVNGTIFQLNNNGAASYDFSNPDVAYLDVVTNTGSVTGSGVLTKLVVDTTGITSGTFGLELLGTDYGDSAVYLPTGSSATVQFASGSLLISVPEPAIMGVAGLATLLLKRTRL